MECKLILQILEIHILFILLSWNCVNVFFLLFELSFRNATAVLDFFCWSSATELLYLLCNCIATNIRICESRTHTHTPNRPDPTHTTQNIAVASSTAAAAEKVWNKLYLLDFFIFVRAFPAVYPFLKIGN